MQLEGQRRQRFYAAGLPEIGVNVGRWVPVVPTSAAAGDGVEKNRDESNAMHPVYASQQQVDEVARLHAHTERAAQVLGDIAETRPPRAIWV